MTDGSDDGSAFGVYHLPQRRGRTAGPSGLGGRRQAREYHATETTTEPTPLGDARR